MNGACMKELLQLYDPILKYTMELEHCRRFEEDKKEPSYPLCMNRTIVLFTVKSPLHCDLILELVILLGQSSAWSSSFISLHRTAVLSTVNTVVWLGFWVHDRLLLYDHAREALSTVMIAYEIF